MEAISAAVVEFEKAAVVKSEAETVAPEAADVVAFEAAAVVASEDAAVVASEEVAVVASEEDAVVAAEAAAVVATVIGSSLFFLTFPICAGVVLTACVVVGPLRVPFSILTNFAFKLSSSVSACLRTLTASVLLYDVVIEPNFPIVIKGTMMAAMPE